MSDHKPTPPPTNKPPTPPSTSKPTTPTLSRRNSLRPAGGHLTPSPSSKPTTPTLSRRNSFRPPGGQLPTTTTTSTWRPPRPQTPLPTPSTSTSNGSRSPIYPRPPLTLSICVHTSLTHLSHYRNAPIRPGTRYRCCCSTHTLRKAISQSSFKYIDGAGGQTVYAAAPARALWCYCSGGEGHVVSSVGEAVERHLALERERSREENVEGSGRVENEKGEESKRDWIGRVEEEASGNGNASRNGDGNGNGNATGSEMLERLSEGQQRVSEAQQRELQTVEWGGTEKALKRQRDFVWLGDKVGRCCRRLGCPWLCKRGEGV